MQGRRIEIVPVNGVFQLESGDYGKHPDGYWYGKTPNGYPCNLKAHSIEEHADGTITVSPSIAVSSTPGKPLWHGHLIRGVWQEC